MKTQLHMSILRAILLACLLGPFAAWAGATDHYWHDVVGRTLPLQAPQPAQYRALSLDSQQIATYLKQAHSSGVASAVSLPLPEGGFGDFTVVDSGTLPKELQEKYPDILSFKGSDAAGRRVRLDMSPLGLQAMVFDPQGIWVVRPEIIAGGSGHYLSYRRAELATPAMNWQCGVRSGVPHLDEIVGDMARPETQTGVNQRVYRAAVAANNYYIAAVGGGTVAGGLAATTTAVNRVSQVYEYEMSIQLVLVPNNDLIMYPNAGSDPFASNGSSVINNSTSIISAAIGAGNYDIGHVFTTGSGGVAGLGVVCKSSSKGRGTTGLPNPIGDDFYVDFVAHEMGHQFGGNHPFNGSLGNCSGGNRNGSTAYEPGSGSTIMAYAGICSADNLQAHSDPYFHAISLQEITNYTNGGGNCSANTTNPNQAPVIDIPGLPNGLTIPARTPFLLGASAADPDLGDALRYAWEEWDLGPQAPLTAGDNGSSPIFRSWPPVLTGERVFPSLSTVLGGAPKKGETLPTTNRTLKFRLTVRDRDDSQHGMGTSQSADVSFNVINSAGPFAVSAPAGGVTWVGGATGTVSWDVANTTASPISCASVDIDLSRDGGQTFTQRLATGVTNSGTANVPVTGAATTQARIRVMCSNNVFFNVSPADFTITADYTVAGTVSGLAGANLTLQLNGGSNLAITSNGPFAFPDSLPSGATYNVSVFQQPDTPTQQCSVTNACGTVGSANITNVRVTCVTDPIFSDGFEDPLGGC